MDILWFFLIFMVLATIFWSLLSFFAFSTETRCAQEELERLLPDIERELHLVNGPNEPHRLNKEQRSHLARSLAIARSKMASLDSVQREHYSLRLNDLSYLAEALGIEHATTRFS